MEIIYKRHSIRKYLKEGLSDKQNELMESKVRGIRQKGLFDNEIQAHLVDPDTKQLKLSYGMIRGMAGYMYGYVNQSIKGFIDYGYTMEKLLLKMTKLNIGTCWLGGTFNKKLFSSIDKSENRMIPAVIAYGNHNGNKEKRKKRKAFDELFFENEFGKPLILSKDDQLYSAFEALNLAPSGVNKQPWRIVKNDNTLRFYQHIKLQEPCTGNIDMGIGMAHFEYGLKTNNVPYKWVKENVQGTKQYMYCLSIEIL